MLAGTMSSALYPTRWNTVLPRKSCACVLLASGLLFLCLVTTSNKPWKRPLALLRVQKRQSTKSTEQSVPYEGEELGTDNLFDSENLENTTIVEHIHHRHHNRKGDGWPAPLQAFSQWQVKHSVPALVNESDNDRRHRKFILGRFSCPQQAGNLLHDFTTTLLLAVVTNRTLLWQYSIVHPKWTQDNQRQNCDRILHMKEWIPSYEDWRDTYNLTDPLYVPGVERRSGWNLTQLHETYDRGARLVPNDLTRRHAVEPFISVGKIRTLTSHYELWAGLVFLQEDFSYTFLSQLLGFEEKKNSDVARVISSLYDQGVTFLFGMLLRQSFEFTPALIASVVPSVHSTKNADEVISLGVHSRHASVRDDGSQIQREVACLTQLLEELQSSSAANHTSDCVIYIMTDRETTRIALLQAAQKLECQGVVVAADDGNSSAVSSFTDTTGSAAISSSSTTATTEHGPWAAQALFRDVWLLAKNVRSGFVGYDRSSSALVYEWIVYDAMFLEGYTSPPLRCSLGYH